MDGDAEFSWPGSKRQHRKQHEPIGIGNRAGNAVVQYRQNDGMNQLGNEEVWISIVSHTRTRATNP